MVVVLAGFPELLGSGRLVPHLVERWETLADLCPGSGVDALSLSGTAPDGDDSGDPNSGPGMDPNGKPLNSTWIDPASDEGSSMDPNG